MLNIKAIYPQNKGFTLIELILALAISSLIILPLINLLSLSINSFASVENKDELLLNGNFALDLIKYEIKSADRIISSDKIQGLDNQYQTNIGFVIRTNDDNSGIYKYTTYYVKETKLIRIACERINDSYPSSNYFKGFNEVCEFIDDIDNSKFDGENSMVNLDFKFEHKDKSKLNLKSDIYIRCETDY